MSAISFRGNRYAPFGLSPNQASVGLYQHAFLGVNRKNPIYKAFSANCVKPLLYS